MQTIIYRNALPELTHFHPLGPGHVIGALSERQRSAQYVTCTRLSLFHSCASAALTAPHVSG